MNAKEIQERKNRRKIEEKLIKYIANKSGIKKDKLEIHKTKHLPGNTIVKSEDLTILDTLYNMLLKEDIIKNYFDCNYITTNYSLHKKLITRRDRNKEGWSKIITLSLKQNLDINSIKGMCKLTNII